MRRICDSTRLQHWSKLIVISRISLVTQLLALASATPVSAAKQCYFSYQEFEKAVPHFDIQACPGEALPAEKGFCRVSLDATDVRIYRFSFVDKEPCLDRIEQMSFQQFVQRF